MSVAGCAGNPNGTAPPAGEDVTSRPIGEFVEVDGVRLHYLIAGEGPPAVAIHGASGNLRDWAIGPAAALARTNRVLMFDRPGLGFSGRPERGGDNIRIQAALMRKAADRLGFRRPVVIGHSFGGSVALAWGVDAPQAVSGLMLLAAPSQVWPGGVGLLYDLAGNPVTGPLVTRILPAIASDRFVDRAIARIFAPQDPPDGYVERVGADLALRPAQIRNNAADIAGLKDQIRALVPRYGALTMPVELIHGAADETVPADIHSDVTARTLPRARYARLPGIGHMPHHVAPQAMTAALARLNAA